ncbi:unnamed protein product [Protopolystoma xenopodis]|uniref:Uncharacterized protein n=1 Tax=Protopolystoma xenopodis TaxID=117903 RepID=A0A3S5BNZ3_9PLAT|nr:unnamed protein product [Protopolystoma xenopodis]
MHPHTLAYTHNNRLLLWLPSVQSFSIDPAGRMRPTTRPDLVPFNLSGLVHNLRGSARVTEDRRIAAPFRCPRLHHHRQLLLSLLLLTFPILLAFTTTVPEQQDRPPCRHDDNHGWPLDLLSQAYMKRPCCLPLTWEATFRVRNLDRGIALTRVDSGVLRIFRWTTGGQTASGLGPLVGPLAAASGPDEDYETEELVDSETEAFANTSRSGPLEERMAALMVVGQDIFFTGFCQNSSQETLGQRRLARQVRQALCKKDTPHCLHTPFLGEPRCFSPKTGYRLRDSFAVSASLSSRVVQVWFRDQPISPSSRQIVRHIVHLQMQFGLCQLMRYHVRVGRYIAPERSCQMVIQQEQTFEPMHGSFRINFSHSLIDGLLFCDD